MWLMTCDQPHANLLSITGQLLAGILSGGAAVSYSSKTVRLWLNLGEQQFRNWHTQLPVLRGRDGRRGGFAFAEILALGIVADLTNGQGIPISRIAPVSTDLFTKCAVIPLEQFRCGVCLIDLPGANCSIIEAAKPFVFEATTIVIPLRAVAEDLMRKMTEDERGTQLSLDLATLHGS
jgi:hypothetical protein